MLSAAYPWRLKFAAVVIQNARRSGITIPAPRTFDEYREVIERDDNPKNTQDETARYDLRTAQSWNLAIDVLEKQGSYFVRPLLHLLASPRPRANSIRPVAATSGS